MSSPPTTPPVPAPNLTGAQRRKLRALSHGLSPVVQVGQGGINPGVLSAVDRALLDHELIKVRLHEPEDKRALAETLAAGSHAALCGLIGHTVVLYRPHPKKPKLKP